MKKYEVELVKSVKYTVTIEANSKAEAREFVELNKSLHMKDMNREFVSARIKSVYQVPEMSENPLTDQYFYFKGKNSLH
ncbi:hypothetical protein ACQUQP_02210 [Marinobacterium sp. YM272]|uniref:hypothetical protein n=1 Tax=Marinobacterium sp. YM272 TaxID=3421654 RepID=UPI003D7FAA1A